MIISIIIITIKIRCLQIRQMPLLRTHDVWIQSRHTGTGTGTGTGYCDPVAVLLHLARVSRHVLQHVVHVKSG